MKWFWILLVVAIGILYFSNPDIQDFKVFIKEESKVLIQEQIGTSDVGQALSHTASQLAEQHIEQLTEYEDYYFFSTYKIELTATPVKVRKWHFLGIGGNFLNLSRFYDED